MEHGWMKKLNHFENRKYRELYKQWQMCQWTGRTSTFQRKKVIDGRERTKL